MKQFSLVLFGSWVGVENFKSWRVRTTINDDYAHVYMNIALEPRSPDGAATITDGN
jgi:hypothetical protein